MTLQGPLNLPTNPKIDPAMARRFQRTMTRPVVGGDSVWCRWGAVFAHRKQQASNPGILKAGIQNPPD